MTVMGEGMPRLVGYGSANAPASAVMYGRTDLNIFLSVVDQFFSDLFLMPGFFDTLLNLVAFNV